MRQMLRNAWNAEEGQSIVEYALLLGLLALTGAAALSGARDQSFKIWQGIAAGFTSSAN